MDRGLAETVWHEGASVDYVGNYQGDVPGLLDWLWQAHGALQCHSHQVTNVLVEVDGGTARSEAYVTVALWAPPSEGGLQTEIISRGRYLDRWSRRAGRWAIEDRVHVADMQSAREVPKGHRDGGSTRNREDISYRLFESAK